MKAVRDLQDKRVLLIAPQFFGYEKEIENELIRRGALVDFLPDRPFNSPFMRGVTRVKREWVLPFADRFFLKSVEDFGRSKYDIIFVIIGEALSIQFLTQLRSIFPQAFYVFYMWDALRNKPLLIPNIQLFDKCYTFDPFDAKQYGMVHRPLFFSPGFEKDMRPDFQYHFSFIGTAHSDRYSIISSLKAVLPQNLAIYIYLYLQAPWMLYGQKVFNSKFKGAKKSDFHFSALSKKCVQDIFLNSMAVLDIEHPAQKGLTMRTFETLGANKKLITTNSQVIQTDFYKPENILVINRNAVSNIPESFFQTAYKAPDPLIYRKYSIAGWLDDVIL